MIAIQPGKRTGSVKIPRSKSHEHRLLVADFLAGDYSRLAPAEGDSEDILATKRCLEALKGDGQLAVLDCGESGSTRRFLGPVAAALGKSVRDGASFCAADSRGRLPDTLHDAS